MKIFKLLSIFILSIMLMSNMAMAEGDKLKEKLSKGTIVLTAEIKGCDADEKKYCSGLESGSKKSFMCMIAYEDKLSAQCKLGIQEAALSLKMRAAAIDYAVQDCEADADKFCLKEQPGEGRLIGCLKKNEKKVSKKCVATLKETGLWDFKKK